MRTLSIIYICLLMVIPAELISESNDQCFICHSEGIGDKAGKLYSGDLHFSIGISCADCHGGNNHSDDPDIAMNRSKGFIGKPSKDKIVNICLSCHLNQSTMKKYGSDKPVEHLKYFKESVHNKSDIATCITCHGVHNIKKVSDPKSPVYPTNEVKLCSKCHSDANYIKTFNPGLSTDQFDKYLTSIHGMRNQKGDIKVATCSDCHSAHNIFPAKDPRAQIYAFNIPATCGKCHSNKEYMKGYNIPTDQFDKYSESVHGKALLIKHDEAAPACNDCHGNHGAIPVGVKSISHICGTCHVINAQMFGESPHSKVFEQRKIPQCEVCHSNHLIQKPSDEMFSIVKGSKCIQCHNQDNDKGFIAMITMKSKIDTLISKQNHANYVLDRAENKGMDVSDSKYDLKNISQILIKARTIIHKANLTEFKNAIAPGFDIVNRAILTGDEALNDYYIRRWGLGAASLIITLLTVALYIKIKKIEKTQKLKEK